MGSRESPRREVDRGHHVLHGCRRSRVDLCADHLFLPFDPGPCHVRVAPHRAPAVHHHVLAVHLRVPVVHGHVLVAHRGVPVVDLRDVPVE